MASESEISFCSTASTKRISMLSRHCLKESKSGTNLLAGLSQQSNTFCELQNACICDTRNRRQHIMWHSVQKKIQTFLGFTPSKRKPQVEMPPETNKSEILNNDAFVFELLWKGVQTNTVCFQDNVKDLDIVLLKNVTNACFAPLCVFDLELVHLEAHIEILLTLWSTSVPWCLSNLGTMQQMRIDWTQRRQVPRAGAALDFRDAPSSRKDFGSWNWEWQARQAWYRICKLVTCSWLSEEQ